MKFARSKSTNTWRNMRVLSNYKASGGLLPTEIDKNISDSLFYSDNISFTKTYSVINESKKFYDKFCLMDQQSGNSIISEILKNAEIFISSKKVWDRSELNEILNKVTSTSVGGKFGCLLGGKNTGKSLVLKNFDKSKVFVVNLRKNKHMLVGLINTLKEREFDQDSSLYKSAIQVVSKFSRFARVASVIFEFDFKKIMDAVIEKPTQHSLFQEVILELVAKLGPITIVFDEANLAFNIDDTTAKEYINDLKDALALFTFMTKEESKLNILLVSSEHSFPFRLANPQLCFNLLDFNYFIFAGEVPPNEMYNLLTDVWKIEPDFAKALINIYGGHIWDIYQALIQLEMKKSLFRCLDPTLMTSVQECVDWKGECRRMQEALEQLAVLGFVPLEKRNDPIARAMSEFGVGGVVHFSSKIIGLNEQVWEDYPECNYGIIPSKQSMRLAIVKYLEDKKILDEKRSRFK